MLKYFKIILISLLVEGFLLPTRSQIVINEFMASNSSTIADPQYNNYSDWIELYNSGDSPINLNGYYITDNLNKPEKWRITINTTLPSHGFIIIWADGDSVSLHTPFKLAQEGEEIGLFSPSLILIDSVTYSAQFTDISYGRQTDGSTAWGFFTESTPGASNNTTSYTGLVDNVPEFSLLGGIFLSPQQVELSTPFGGTIRYTTDGSDPEATSPSYSGPLNLNATTILRARVFKSGLIPGNIITNSYFINEGFAERGLPVFSIATNPENFWDPQTGIYVQNFKPDWEVPINIELFENDGSDRAAFNELAGTKINGLYSWQLPQKMLGIYFRKQYGNTRLDYPVIFDRNRSVYKTFALRASGNDWSNTMFRDAMLHNATRYNMNIDIMGYRPSILFVNGQYMGIHNIREKIEEDYIVEHYGLDEGTFDMVENEDYAEAGNLNAYNSFKTLYSKDLSVQANYNAVTSLMDIENYADYIATEIYSGNYSINHNVMAWKSKNAGKWKWILMDLDRAFFTPTDHLINFYINQSVWPLSHLMQNQEFETYFGRRLADHLFTTFNPARIKKLIDDNRQLIEKEMPYHIARWLGTTSSYGDAIPSMDYWYEQVGYLKDFADARPGIIMADLHNYGFSTPANLMLSVSPSNGGYITFNSLRVPGPTCTGPYLMNVPVSLVAVDNPGYDFTGWAQPVQHTVIAGGTEWKYLDNGTDQGSAWRDPLFNDGGWQSGPAEFGYGDGDEQTIVSYGSDANNKYITTYFRKSFDLTSGDLSASPYIINLLRDDGAVVYLNGEEIIRSNMPSGNIGFQTLASSSVSGSAESEFISYAIGSEYFREGTNLLSIEVHQSAANSSDLSFDLELTDYRIQAGNYLSTDRNYSLTLTGDRNLVAVYEPDGNCIIPDSIKSDLTLNKDCSPYIAQGDITVASGVKFTIEPGVEIRMAEQGNMYIYGSMQAIGTEDEPILFTLNPDYADSSWGALCFMNSADTSTISYATLEYASGGPDPVRQIAAISGFYAHLNLDHLTIENVNRNPVLGRYSSIVLTNSSLHSEVTGDLINVKYGKARIENCLFRGNYNPDTDGIDYDDVEDGVIRNCEIHELLGSNSDGIDIGEKTSNLTIDSVLIYNITDKGVSVGQQSTANVQNCIFINCNLGLGLKDSCKVHINHCTFYGTGTPIACFEKNPGSAGGNAKVNNCILSNSYDNSFLVDERSTWQISNSLADNDLLPDEGTNLFDNPAFINPGHFDFRLLSSSPCQNSGSDNGTVSPMGSLYHNDTAEPSLMFSYIYCDAENNPGHSEFLGITNPASDAVDMMGYKITMGIDYVFKEPLTIGPGETIFLVKDLSVTPPESYNGQVFQWSSGNLANEGEAVRLVDKQGMVLDQVIYSDEQPWPDYSSAGGAVLSLISFDLDNHFAESWKIIDYSQVVNTNDDSLTNEFRIFPNPSAGLFHMEASDYPGQELNVYSIAGKLVSTVKLDAFGTALINLNNYESGVYLVRISNVVKKIILLK
jgi:hypothetical protein